MATTSSTSGSKGTTKRPAPRKRAATAATRARSASAGSRARAVTDDAKAAVRSVRTKAGRAVKKVPTDATTLSIAAGVIAGAVAAGVAIFMNRDRLRDAASTGGERLRKAADDLSTMAHERIDQARDNITKLRARATEAESKPQTPTDFSAVG